MKKFFFVAALFVLFSSQLSFGQMACYVDYGYGIYEDHDANNCLTAYGAYVGTNNTINVVLDPYSKWGALAIR